MKITEGEEKRGGYIVAGGGKKEEREWRFSRDCRNGLTLLGVLETQNIWALSYWDANKKLFDICY